MSIKEKEEYVIGEALGHLYWRAHTLLKRAILTAFREEGLDVTTEQWVILAFLHEKGSCSLSQLVERSLKDNANVGRIVDKLAKKEWLERKALPGDKRGRMVSLTESGEEMYQKLVAVIQDANKKQFSHFEPEELEQAVSFTKKLIGHLS